LLDRSVSSQNSSSHLPKAQAVPPRASTSFPLKTRHRVLPASPTPLHNLHADRQAVPPQGWLTREDGQAVPPQGWLG